MIGIGPPSRQRRMKSSFGRRIARTREYYYSLYTILAVKIVLFAFLWVLFATSIRIMRASFRNIPELWRFALPGVIAAVAVFTGYHIVKNIKEIIEYGKEIGRKP